MHTEMTQYTNTTAKKSYNTPEIIELANVEDTESFNGGNGDALTGS